MGQDEIIRRRVRSDLLRRLRQEKLLTQDELAKEAGVSRVTISSYERGVDKPPSTAHIRRVAAALGVEARDIVEIISL